MTELKDILDEIQNKKAPLFKKYLEKIESKEKVKPQFLKDIEGAEKSEYKIKTGTVIDGMIGGGFPEGKSAMFYGEFASGKTQTCETLAILSVGKVIYIDTENSLRCERMEEMCKTRGIDWATVRDKILYYNPKDWVEQMQVAQSLPSPSDVDGKVDLIICDSYSKHFRGIEFIGRDTLVFKNGLLREFIFCLERAAKQHRAVLIYTTQIYDTPDSGPYTSKADTQRPVGGHSTEHQPDFNLYFRKSTGNVRIVRMVDSSFNPLAERAFIINEKGIDDLPEDTKVAKQVAENAGKFEQKQHQETLKPEKKKKDEKQEETAESQ